MIQPIRIDASEFAQAFAISEDDIKQFTSNIISELAAEFAIYWDKAADVLGSTRNEYKRSIYTEKIDDYNYVVGLNGFLPNAIEQGLEPFDEKTGFRNSDKAIETQDGGWYLTIPFRFATPEAIGESSAFTGVLPSQVYEKAKELGPGENLLRRDLPEEFQAPTTRPKIVTKSRIWEEYQRKHSIYEGMIRNVDRSGRGQYVTFRRASSKSDPNSWIHTGIDSRNLAEKAFEDMDIESTVDAIVNKYIEQL